MPEPSDSVADALKEIERLAGSGGSPKPQKQKRVRPLRWIGLFAGLLLAPFWVLILGASGLVQYQGLGAWPALGVSAVVTALLIAGYFAIAGRRLGVRLGAWAPRMGLAVVVAYCVYGLLFLSPNQFKRPEIQETYSALHPVIRLSLATMVLVDSEAVITDAARAPEDYGAMNLPVNQRSLHYPQESGFVHAVDLRTIGRPEWLNSVVTVYLRSMGLKVLRHTGTADHLHVYLPPRG